MTKKTSSNQTSKQPHYIGHRDRLRARFMAGNGQDMPDYELLELVLFRSMPRRDVKPLAKQLIARFGSFAEVITAPPSRLKEIDRIGDASIIEFKIINAAALKLAWGKIIKRPVMSSWEAVINYCRSSMAFADKEIFRILFLDKKNVIIADEIQQTGTVDYIPVYPREVVKRALELSASGMILVHNHPSGDPTPSNADIKMTKTIKEIATSLDILVQDHIIIAKQGHISLRALELI